MAKNFPFPCNKGVALLNQQAMSNPSEAKCPRCAAPLPPSAPEGLCPRCLGALNLLADTALTGVPPVPAQPPLTPAELAPHFPQLEILECLGRGGMGVVYKARQKSLNRVVALKLLAPERVTEAGFAERFTREAQALARLNHPNIVTIHDFGTTTPPDSQLLAPSFFFLIMEFVDGVNLRQAMKAGRFTPEQALAIVPPVCEALQYAHEQGIVHRDIKPENLLLDKAGRLKIADFGIAKILESGSAGLPSGLPVEGTLQRGPTAQESFTAGTPGYMAPEQKSAPQRVDSRADIYSLGVVIYEMLTGELPAEKLQPPSRKVQIDVRLDEIVLRALEQRPELRFQTAADLRTQVETVVATPLAKEDGGERIEKSKQPPSLSSTLSPLSSPSRPFLKVGTSTLTTPKQLATASGQFFCYRTRGQLILDDRQLTHSRDGADTVIPLAAIRDLSIGHYPRSMNPAGLDLLSVTYEEGGQRKQVLLSPMEGWFGFPSTFNARVAEWFTAIRAAVTAATGRAPATTPAEQLGVPGSSKLLLAVACVPILTGAGLLLVLLRGPGSPGSFANGVVLLTFVALVGGYLAPVLFGWLSRGRNTSSPGSSSIGKFSAFLVVLVLLLVLGFGMLQFFAHIPSSTGVTRFDFAPVGVSNNVVIVDVTTEVGRGNAELRAMLDGPPLPAATEAALADAFFPPFAGTLIKPTTHAGNHPWRILSPGRQTWRLGFVLPDAALAKEAFDNLRPIGPLPAVPDRTFAGTLFEVRQTNGQEYRAALHVMPPVTSADTNWVNVFNQSMHSESALHMTWTVHASQPGSVRLTRGGNLASTQLKLDPKSKLHEVKVRLELTKLGTNRVLLVTEMGGVKSREELAGRFQDLADEVLRARNQSFKTVRGASMELCQFRGESIIVRVDALPMTTTTAVPTKVVHWGFSGMPLWPVLAVVVLTVIIGGIVLVVVLERKGGTGGKIALLLVGAAGLFLAIAIAALFVWRKASSDFGPGVGLVRLAKSGQMTLESNYPAPAQPHPPGQVQQTQNGFRLQLPAAQLASFEFFLRQADDSWQPVPSLTALVATGTNSSYYDTLYWTLRRGSPVNGNITANQLWFWTVSANANAGRPLPQLTDHGTNFTHLVQQGESLDWWQLAVPASVTLKPGEQQIIPLFRTHGTATVRGEHPKEAFLRVRCEPLPAGLGVLPGQQFVEAGLAARALLAKSLPAKPSAAAAAGTTEGRDLLTGLLGDLAAMRASHGEQHPDVKALRAQITAVESALTKGEDPKLAKLRGDLAVMLQSHGVRHPDAVALRARVTAVETSLAKKEPALLVDLRGEFAAMSQSYGPQHPEIQELRARIAAVETSLARGESATLVGLRGELAAMLLRYGEKHPKMVELRARLAAVQSLGENTVAPPAAKAP